VEENLPEQPVSVSGKITIERYMRFADDGMETGIEMMLC